MLPNITTREQSGDPRTVSWGFKLDALIHSGRKLEYIFYKQLESFYKYRDYAFEKSVNLIRNNIKRCLIPLFGLQLYSRLGASLF